ncbi:MAG: hypothetical protein IJD17_05595 [Clostridia bacterium]|nr:hypothetical protein [Clostridia bacterium]
MINVTSRSRSAAPLIFIMASALILLHAASLALSMRYAYISTDILAKTEAAFLITAASVLSPLCIYFRLGLLIIGSFTFVKKASLPFLFCAVGSLIVGAGCDLFISARYDAYFAGNEALYVVAALLSLSVGIVTFLIVRAYAQKKRPDGRRGLVRSFLFGAAVVFITDTLYRTYTLFRMLLSADGVSFQGAEDYLYLAYDYLYPLAEAALGFGFMCLCGVVFRRLFVKRTDR